MIICEECDWRYPENEGCCPRCGKEKPDNNMVRQWNSTLKADPSKKPKRSWIKPKKRDPDLKQAMEEVAKDHLEKHNGKAVCQNCGKPIRELKYANISHIKKRSTHPELRTEVENMEVLCCGQDYWGEVDNSCHTVWERNDFQKFMELKNARQP